MILDGSKGWYWYLKSLPEKIRECDIQVRFSIIEREIGDKFCARTMMIDEDVVAFGIEDADTLLGILFDESLKSKSIAAIDENWSQMSIMNITIVLVQGAEGYTNIDEDVLGSFARCFNSPH